MVVMAWLDRIKTACNAWLGLDLLAYEGDH